MAKTIVPKTTTKKAATKVKSPKGKTTKPKAKTLAKVKSVNVKKAKVKKAKTVSSSAYPPHSILSTGLAGKCPRCAQGALFQSFMKPVARCGSCGLDMSFAEEGDGPAVFAIFILGFIMVGMALYVEYTFRPAFWVHILLWVPTTTILSTMALKLIKGVMIAAQYKTDAREGRWEGKGKK